MKELKFNNQIINNLKKLSTFMYKLGLFMFHVTLMFWTFNIFSFVTEDSSPNHKNLSKATKVTPRIYFPKKVDILQKNRFISKLMAYSDFYVKEAKKRDVEVISPLVKFTFRNDPESIESDDPKVKFSGFCDTNNKVIYLNMNFNLNTFLHELGHCDLDYSHLPDLDYFNNKNSNYIMHWRFKSLQVSRHFNISAYYSNRLYISESDSKILDHFFDKSKHHSLDSRKGDMFHNVMEYQIHYYEKYKESFWKTFVAVLLNKK